MIRINGRIPEKVGVAVSGGPDSMAILDFLSNSKRKISVFHFDHGTKHGREAAEFIKEYCQKKNLELFLNKANRERTKDESPEEYWRNMRYDFFRSYDFPIITCHHLDDQVEQWVMTSLHGEGRLIPPSNRNVIRPFMTTTKEQLISWCERRSVPFIIDPSNSEDKYMRSYVRKNLIPHALRVNPGLYKVIKKKVLILYRDWLENND